MSAALIVLAIALVFGVLIYDAATTERVILWAYWLTAFVGVAVGATEMMARYRDAPFAPLLSIPGIFYIFINGAAAASAYYVIDDLGIPIESPALKVLTAGLGAMAIFRSGFFTVRMGEADVAVGPNLVLQIMLNALDRAYDRDRATPRSIAIAQIMAGVSFEQAHKSLPSICFNLMQNTSDAEKEAIGREVEELASADMSDEAKTLTLGLALFNVVGDKTLEAAVDALGNTVKGFKPIDQAMLLELAKVSPADAVQALPMICNELCDRKACVENPALMMARIVEQPLSDESKAVLTLYKLVRQYGETTVSIALTTMTR